MANGSETRIEARGRTGEAGQPAPRSKTTVAAGGDPGDPGGNGAGGASPIELAVQDARRELALQWMETGCWRDYCDAGPAATAVVAVALSFIGALDRVTSRGVVVYLRKMALPDGTFASYPGGDTGDLAATAACYAGLIAAGENEQNLAKAKAFIDASGGEDKLIEMARAGDLAALALAMVGKLNADLPTTPLLFGLAPGSEYLLAQRFGYLVPFRALVSDVVAGYLRGNKTNTKTSPSPAQSLRLPRLPSVPGNANELADQLSLRLRAATDYATTATANVTRSGTDLVANLAKGASRTLLGIAQGGLTAAAGVADSFRLGPARILDGTLRAALEAGRAVTGGAMAAASTLDQLRPSAFGAGRTVVQQVEGLRCDLYLHRFRNEDGSWLYGDSVHTALALAAYHALGVPSSDQTIVESVDWLKSEPIMVAAGDGSGTRFNVFYTDIWSTAFVLRALLESGTQVTDPAISRAINWLIAVQRSGSWAFQATNTTTPDMDDSAVAMATLAIARDKLATSPVEADPNLTAVERQSLLARCDTAIAAARAFIVDRQNADGGWASYQPGLPGKNPGPIMTKEPQGPQLDSLTSQVKFTFNPPADLGDPATEDVTARVLFALGKSGITANDPAVAKAIQFLINQQDTNHGWWGRWVVNYVASTAWVLRGLKAVGADLQAPFVTNAVGFLLSRQRPDGGWTDSVKSYRTPAFTPPPGVPSNPCLTGLVLCALIDLGEAQSIPVQKGIDFLLRYHHDQKARHPDETGWQVTDLDALHSLYPPALFYTLPQTVLQLPLEALALYQKATAAVQPAAYAGPASAGRARVPIQLGGRARDPFETLRLPLAPEQVLSLKHQGDVEADAIVDAIWKQTSQIASQDARIGALFQSLVQIADFTEESSLEGLSVSDAKKVEAKLALPVKKPQLDEKRVANAQKLFQDSGFGVPLVLFCSSLPQCYAVPYGAEVLLASGRLVTNPRRRMIETAQFVFDVLSPGGLVAVPDKEIKEDIAAGRLPPGRGLRSARKVRLMHAAIRKLVGDDQGRTREGTTPLSQFEMLGTLMTFAVVVTDGLRALGLPVTDEQADDWFYLWRQVGQALGVVEPVGFSLETAADGADFFEHVREDWAPSPEGSGLARTSLDLMRELLPTELNGVGPTLIRHLAGERCADLLGVEPSDWTQILIDPSPLVATIEGRVVGRVFETPLTPLLQQAAYATLQALSLQQREGKNAQFSIPPDFLNAWRNGFQAKFRV